MLTILPKKSKNVNENSKPQVQDPFQIKSDLPPEEFFKYSGTNAKHFTWKEAPSEILSQNAQTIEGEAREQLLKSLKLCQSGKSKERTKKKVSSIPRQSTPVTKVSKNESNGKIVKKKKRVKTTLVKELFYYKLYDVIS